MPKINQMFLCPNCDEVFEREIVRRSLWSPIQCPVCCNKNNLSLSKVLNRAEDKISINENQFGLLLKRISQHVENIEKSRRMIKFKVEFPKEEDHLKKEFYSKFVKYANSLILDPEVNKPKEEPNHEQNNSNLFNSCASDHSNVHILTTTHDDNPNPINKQNEESNLSKVTISRSELSQDSNRRKDSINPIRDFFRFFNRSYVHGKHRKRKSGI